MYVMKMVCDQAHITDVEMINAELHADGTVSGYMGSSAEFCDVCDSTEMTALGVVEVAA